MIDDPYNHCIYAFADHNYEAASLLAKQLILTHDPATVFPSINPLRSFLSGLLPAMAAGRFLALPLVLKETSVFSMFDDTKNLPR